MRLRSYFVSNVFHLCFSRTTHTNATRQSSHLIRPKQVKTDVWVARCGIQRVLAEVFTHVLRSGLWEQTIYALPKSHNYGYKSTGHRVNPIKTQNIGDSGFYPEDVMKAI